MIQQIKDILKFILPYLQGNKQVVIGIIASVLIASVSVYIEKYIDYKLNKNSVQISEQIDEQVKGIVVETLDNKETKYNERINKALEKYPEIDLQIDQLLDQLNEQIKSNQSVLFIFHDGTKTPDGFPFIKYSATNEAINERRFKITTRLQTHQSIPYSKIAFYAKKMAETGIYYIDNINQIENRDESNYFALREEGVKSVAFIPVELKHTKKPIGFVTIYGYDNYIKFEDDSIYIETICDLIAENVQSKYKK